MVYIKLATGVGGGLILDGALYGGARGTAGELGHVMVQPDGRICRCGNRGCLELVAAVPALPSTGATRAGGYVARAVAPVCLALDVPLVVIGGDGAATPRLVAGVRTALRKACEPMTIEVRPAALAGRAEALGAVALALGQDTWLNDAGLISLVDNPAETRR
jgi:predicted NBD/HSP70 family sugar kinase